MLTLWWQGPNRALNHTSGMPLMHEQREGDPKCRVNLKRIYTGLLHILMQTIELTKTLVFLFSSNTEKRKIQRKNVKCLTWS